MRAAVLYEAGTPLVVEDVELGAPRVGEVLVRIAATGVCHSDLHYIKGDLSGPLPIVLGHEAAGIVEGLGPGVDSVKVGDHVVLLFAPACGHCRYCASGRPHLCEMRFRVRGKMPDGTSRRARVAANSIISRVSPHGRNRPSCPRRRAADRQGRAVQHRRALGVRGYDRRRRGGEHGARPPGATVAVFGLGGVGLNVVQGARIAGAVTIIGVDVLTHRLEAARRFGATHTVNAKTDDPVKAIRDLTGGGVDYAFEVIGRAATVRQAVDSVGRGGVAVAVGLPPSREELTVPGPSFVLDEKTLRACFYGSSRLRFDIPRLLALYHAGRLMLDELVTAAFPLDRVNEAVAALDRGDGLRSILQMAAN